MPNILITGTPGTGKTTLAAAIVAAHPHMRHIELSKVIAEQELHEGRDEHFDTLIFDDDKVVDYLEDVMDIHKHRNTIIDFHTTDFFPERWFDLVIVLRTSAGIHFERLQEKYVMQRLFWKQFFATSPSGIEKIDKNHSDCFLSSPQGLF
jgi:adenylate kinase